MKVSVSVVGAQALAAKVLSRGREVGHSKDLIA